MIPELLSENAFVWTCLWQSTACVAPGLIGSLILRRRPARAHQVLLLAMIAAIAVPAMSIMVRHLDLGVLSAEPAAVWAESANEIVLPESTYAAGDIIAGDTGTGFQPVSPARMAVPPESPAVESAEAGATAALPAEKSEILWSRILSWAWAAASLILIARLLVTFVRGRYVIRRATPIACEDIQAAARAARVKLAVAKEVSVLGSRHIRSPVIWCWGKNPVLLVPSNQMQAGNEIDWVSVLCHELAHCKRHDHINGLLAELAVCMLPWNPLLWWAKARLVQLSEQACDDWVVASGQSTTDYVRSLLDLVPQGQMALVPTVVASKKELAARVSRIIQNRCTDPRAGRRWAVVVTIVAACLALGTALAQEGRTDRETPRRETAATEPRQQGEVPSERARQPGEAERAELIQFRLTLLDKISKIERELEQLPADRDAEARELQARLREIRNQVQDIDRRLGGPGREPEAMPIREQRQRETHIRELAEHREQLANKARDMERRLAERPDSPDARELQPELKEIHEQIRRIKQELAELERPPREQRERKVGGADARTAELMRQRGELIERARQIKRQVTEAGDTERAEKLREEEATIREKIEAIERQLRGPERERLRPEQAGIEELRQAIARALEQGRGDEAERLQRELRQLTERPQTRPEPRPEARDFEQQVRELRNEVQGLRQEMAELRELLRQLLQRQQRERSPEAERREREPRPEQRPGGAERPRF